MTAAGSQPAYIFTVGDVILNARTGERMAVATIASTTTITVAAGGRSIGANPAAAGADGDGLFIIGNASEQNSGARNINTTQSTPITNYTQIFKTTIGVAGTEKEANLYGGKDLVYLRAKMATQHALDIERAFIWGSKDTTTGSLGHPLTYTGGVLEFIENGNAYVQNQGGPLTAPDFNTFLREGFTYGDNTKLFMCGGILLQAINEFARGQIVMAPLSESYGMRIGHYATPFGEINIVHNPLMVEEYAGHGFLLDMECLRYRFMNNRDTKLYTNVQAPDVDGEVDQWVTEAGLERNHSAKCALIKGVTA